MTATRGALVAILLLGILADPCTAKPRKGGRSKVYGADFEAFWDDVKKNCR